MNRKTLGLLFSLLLLLGCSERSTAHQERAASGVVTLDMRRVIERNPDIQKLQTEEKGVVERIKSLDQKGQKLQEEKSKELEKISDRQSIAWRNLESQSRRELEAILHEIDQVRLTFFQKKSQAYDRAYTEIMRVALIIAKRQGAAVVLPQVELPNPHLEATNFGDPAAQFNNYLTSLRLRPVVASTARIDITGDVIRELNWKK